MYQGFYDLASGIITQRRNLNNISNNMVNVQTAGYKKDNMVSTTFQEQMLIRTGRYNKRNPSDIEITSKIKSASRTYTDYEQGAFEITDNVYDFAIAGQGFFAIQTEEGIRYTRGGTFSVDQEGFLELPGLGYVMDTNNQRIQLANEFFNVDQDGSIYQEQISMVDEAGNPIFNEGDNAERGAVARLKLVDFQNYEDLHKEDNGIFSTNQAEQAAAGGTSVVWKALEKSNVNMVEEMANMMSSQRALQSAAQVLKMYDNIMGKSSSDVGRL